MFNTVTQEGEIVDITEAIYEVCMRHLCSNVYK